MSKQITIPVPDGKRAEWINGVLTLVDEQKVDNRPVTERIKTFTDACNAIGDEHPLVKEYLRVADGNIILDDLYAYLKLRIIVAALNEGWEPKFEKGEYRYFPWFYLYTKEQYDELDDEEKWRCVLRSGYSTFSFSGFVSCAAYHDASLSSTSLGSRLTFRSRELAAYAGRQFIEEWADFMFKPRTGEELNGKSEAAKTTIDFNNNEDE
nr:MAG TPA: Poxvirus A28 family [Caudoviricetes sp.]